MPLDTQQGINWKVGDKAFYEHKEVTIREIEDGRVYCVTDGMFMTSGSRINEHLFPITEGGKKIVDFFHEQYEALHEMPGENMFNWPDLARDINERFDETMRSYHAGDANSVTVHLAQAGLLFRQIRVVTTEVLGTKLGNLYLFGRR
jgi:hypothetical protein